MFITHLFYKANNTNAWLRGYDLNLILKAFFHLYHKKNSKFMSDREGMPGPELV
jgi:hypothetical protein